MYASIKLRKKQSEVYLISEDNELNEWFALLQRLDFALFWQCRKRIFC